MQLIRRNFSKARVIIKFLTQVIFSTFQKVLGNIMKLVVKMLKLHTQLQNIASQIMYLTPMEKSQMGVET
jgi:hypothetical protein